jgi:hypothetical protein
MPAWEPAITRAGRDNATSDLTIAAETEISAAGSLEERRRHSAQRIANAAWERATPAEAPGWQSHTVRGFLAGLKRKGITVEVLERIRQVGPNKDGAKGSYSVYRVA